MIRLNKSTFIKDQTPDKVLLSDTFKNITFDNDDAVLLGFNSGSGTDKKDKRTMNEIIARINDNRTSVQFVYWLYDKKEGFIRRTLETDFYLRKSVYNGKTYWNMGISRDDLLDPDKLLEHFVSTVKV